MKLTPLDGNILDLLAKSIDKAMFRLANSNKKRSLSKRVRRAYHPESEQNVLAAIRSVFSEVSAKARRPKRFSELSRDVCKLLCDLCEMRHTGSLESQRMEEMLLADLHKHALEYDLMSQVPRPRRERKARQPMTQVEEKLSQTETRIREWERRLKYAKTRLAKLHRRKKYYAKKGAAV